MCTCHSFFPHYRNYDAEKGKYDSGTSEHCNSKHNVDVPNSDYYFMVASSIIAWPVILWLLHILLVCECACGVRSSCLAVPLPPHRCRLTRWPVP